MTALDAATATGLGGKPRPAEIRVKFRPHTNPARTMPGWVTIELPSGLAINDENLEDRPIWPAMGWDACDAAKMSAQMAPSADNRMTPGDYRRLDALRGGSRGAVVAVFRTVRNKYAALRRSSVGRGVIR